MNQTKTENKKELLLISNSFLYGSGYLDHCESQIREVLGNGTANILFLPYARPSGKTHDEFTAIARERFGRIGYNHFTSLHEIEERFSTLELIRELRRTILSSDAIFVGGGNTFVLLDKLLSFGPLVEDAIQEAVESGGVKYIGASAGSNIAGRTI